MSVPLTINGTTYQYPQQFDTNWGPTLTAWSTAVTNGMLQKAGGSFTLTSEVNFGSSFGLKTLYIKSQEANIASTGFFRLANNSTGVGFRNSTNTADLLLSVNTSNQLTFNGLPVGAVTALLDSHILVGNASNQPADVAMSGDITITNAGVTAIGALKVANANIATAAAIALTKLASTTAYYWYAANATGVLTPLAVTASRAVATDANGLPVAATTTATELGYVSGVTSSIQTQINALNSTPTGMLADFAGTVPPTGWLVCDGSAINRTTYSALFAVISTTWGVGDGSTTFNIPALSRRVNVGSGGSGTATLGNTVGSTGGEETHTLTVTEMPAHSHSFTASPLLLTAGAAPSFSSASGTVTTSTTGSSGAHNIMQPSAVVLKIIKT